MPCSSAWGTNQCKCYGDDHYRQAERDFDPFDSSCRLMRVHKKICKGFEVFEYYANNQWDFDNSNLRYLRTVINETERARYKIDAEGLDMMKYFEVSPRILRSWILYMSNI